LGDAIMEPVMREPECYQGVDIEQVGHIRRVGSGKFRQYLGDFFTAQHRGIRAKAQNRKSGDAVLHDTGAARALFVWRQHDSSSLDVGVERITAARMPRRRRIGPGRTT
jgi:hypothetical protein